MAALTINSERELALFLYGMKAAGVLGLKLEAIGPAGCHFLDDAGDVMGGYWTASGCFVAESQTEPYPDPIHYAGEGLALEALTEAAEIFRGANNV
jgi:hypothetical protein